MMPNYDFLLYFGRSLYRHFWIKSIKIHEILKDFQKIFHLIEIYQSWIFRLSIYFECSLYGHFQSKSIEICVSLVAPWKIQHLKTGVLKGPILSNSDFLLYIWCSLYHHFWIKLIEIHKLLKVYWKILRPTAFY